MLGTIAFRTSLRPHTQTDSPIAVSSMLPPISVRRCGAHPLHSGVSSRTVVVAATLTVVLVVVAVVVTSMPGGVGRRLWSSWWASSSSLTHSVIEQKRSSNAEQQTTKNQQRQTTNDKQRTTTNGSVNVCHRSPLTAPRRNTTLA